MTDAQIEIAARKLCKLHGINPDDECPYIQPPDIFGTPVSGIWFIPRWKVAADAIRRHLLMQEVIEFGKASPS